MRDPSLTNEEIELVVDAARRAMIQAGFWGEELDRVAQHAADQIAQDAEIARWFIENTTKGTVN